MNATGAGTATRDPFAAARLVADAVLFEGYVLYPYRASAQKNQMRWQFGVLAPRTWTTSTGSDRTTMCSEVIVDPRDNPVLTVRIRCLQVQQRLVEAGTDTTNFVHVTALNVGGRTLVAWDEAVEHEIDIASIELGEVTTPFEHHIKLPAGDEIELLFDSSGQIVGRLVRRREHVDGLVRVTAIPVEGSLLKITVAVENTSDWDEPGACRDEAMLHSLVAVHTLLALAGGSFMSLLEPPEFAQRAVAGCMNEGTFPVLIGGAGTSDVMLSSPIILYDYAAVAPESAGDFCDATEIDEILALRVMTLTDDEKAEARGTDPRSAAIIDRCDEMPDEIWSRLHGAIRSLRPVEPSLVPAVVDPVEDPSVPWWDPGQDSSFDPFADSMYIGAHEVRSGTRVRLHPSRRADAHDLFYTGQLATVKGVFNDVDENQHVAVVLDDDPASDMFDWQGRYLYFHPEEIEVLG